MRLTDRDCVNTFVGRVLRLRRNTLLQGYASFDSLLSRAGLGNRGKGWSVRDTASIGLHY